MVGDLTLTRKVVQNEGNIVSKMDGNTVMMNIRHGKYYNLGKTGSDIWAAIASPSVVEEVVDSLAAGYQVDRGTCTRHVISFLEQLLAEDLIRICE